MPNDPITAPMSPSSDPDDRSQSLQELVDLGAATVRTSRGTVHTLTIAGQIEGHQLLPETVKSTKYEHILPLLASLEQNEQVDGVLILLNTVGSDIEAGLAIAELISGMSTPTVSLVLGGGHSIGVPLAVAARRSFIAPSAAMTIHPVRTTGLVIAAPQTYRYFARIQDRITAFVCQHSSVSPEKFRSLLSASDELASDVGSVLYGEEAVAAGLIDEVGDLSAALNHLFSLIRRKKNPS